MHFIYQLKSLEAIKDKKSDSLMRPCVDIYHPKTQPVQWKQMCFKYNRQAVVVCTVLR